MLVLSTCKYALFLIALKKRMNYLFLEWKVGHELSFRVSGFAEGSGLLWKAGFPLLVFSPGMWQGLETVHSGTPVSHGVIGLRNS